MQVVHPGSSTTAVTSSPNPSTFGRIGDHNRDGKSGGTAGADGHRELHLERHRDFRLHGSAADFVAYGGLHDFDAGGGDGCHRSDLLGRHELFRQQRHALATG